MKQSCLGLTGKIKTFEKKYVEHYLDDGSKFEEAGQTLDQLRYRQKMIDDIKAKVQLYQDCLNIMNIGQQQPDWKDITCFDDFKNLELLHGYTLKLWTILDQWRTQRTSLLTTPFLHLDFAKTSNFVEECNSFFEFELAETPLFQEKL